MALDIARATISKLLMVVAFRGASRPRLVNRMVSQQVSMATKAVGRLVWACSIMSQRDWTRSLLSVRACAWSETMHVVTRFEVADRLLDVFQARAAFDRVEVGARARLRPEPLDAVGHPPAQLRSDRRGLRAVTPQGPVQQDDPGADLGHPQARLVEGRLRRADQQADDEGDERAHHAGGQFQDVPRVVADVVIGQAAPHERADDDAATEAAQGDQGGQQRTHRFPL